MEVSTFNEFSKFLCLYKQYACKIWFKYENTYVECNVERISYLKNSSFFITIITLKRYYF